MVTARTPRKRPAKRPKRNPAGTGSTACTPEMIEAVRAILSTEPLSYADACAAAGISRSTFYVWQERGHEELAYRSGGGTERKGEQPYVDFVHMLTRAELDMKRTLIEPLRRASAPKVTTTKKLTREPLRENGAVVRDARSGEIIYKEVEQVSETEEPGDWRSSFELLRRRFHDEWGDRTRAEHSGPAGGPIHMTIPVQNTDAAALAELGAAMLEAGLISPTEGSPDGEST